MNGEISGAAAVERKRVDAYPYDVALSQKKICGFYRKAREVHNAPRLL
jgi:hypothetical protein